MTKKQRKLIDDCSREHSSVRYELIFDPWSFIQKCKDAKKDEVLVVFTADYTPSLWSELFQEIGVEIYYGWSHLDYEYIIKK